MALSTDRQTFRETVAVVAALAKAKLPQAVNGRVESAVKLVLAHDVTVLDDGSIEVGSSSDPLKTYRLTGQACTCQDFERGQAPSGWCQHRIAAGIANRVRELLPVVPEVVEPFPDNDPEEPAPPSPAVPLPEAPASCNVYVTIGGHKVQVTLRDTSEHRMLARLRTLLAQYPAPEVPTQGQPSQGQDKSWCTKHQVPMRWNDGKDGKRGWYSHRHDSQWCKGK